MASVVFKVKYGTILRRFNVSINEDQCLDLNVASLRSKICSLFKFPSDAEFRLTYRDEDNDIVTLADDDDLLDVVRQGLDPVRIHVRDLLVIPAALAPAPAPAATPTNNVDAVKISEVKWPTLIESVRVTRPTDDYSSSMFPDVADCFYNGPSRFTCNDCGIDPIPGPCYTVRHDCHLCCICILKAEDYTDYGRIDFPLDYENPQSESVKPSDVRSSTRRPHLKLPRLRLDSCLSRNVDGMDETIMAPSAPFTKIWWMRNKGSLPWYPGLQFICVSGHQLRPTDSIEIQVPVYGVDPDQELEIAVDFIAPELPGRYIALWRMADSSGKKFGQVVEVEIQVEEDHSVKLTREISPALNLNLPPETPKADNVEVKLEFDLNHKIQMLDLNLPINDDLHLLVADNVTLSPVPQPAASTADKPESVVRPSRDSFPELDNVCCRLIARYVDNIKVEEADEKTETEEQIAEEVISGGAVDYDVSDDSDWDPILDELSEMGFEDKDINKTLLAKNHGSISRVVMDLIAEERT